MLMTEEEAKKKVCCQAMSRGYTHCVASDCMAWRWGGFGPPSAPPSARRGYCGLAGKVEE